MIRISIRSLVLLLTFQAMLVGCRGPWFKRTDKFDPIVVSEQTEPRNPREFASSRMRPTNPADTKAALPKSESRVRTISDAAESQEVDELVAVDDSLSAEHRELYQRQVQALKNKAAGDLLEINDSAPLPSNTQVDSGSSFSLSDDDGTASTPASSTPATPEGKSEVIQSPEKQLAKHQLVKQESRANAGSQKTGVSRENGRATTGVDRVDAPKTEVIQAAERAPVDGDRSARTAIAIEATNTDWRTLALEAREALKSEAESASAQSPSQQLAIEAKLRMLSLVLDDLEGAMTPIEFLEPDAKDYFTHQFQALHAATDPQGNPVINRRWTIALQSQRKALTHLAAVSNLEVQNVAFCTEVDSFGIISKFPQYHFKRDQELLLYCELDNFVSEKLKNEYETKLQGSYEIVDSSGRRVADQMLPPDEHICSNQRRDYFIAYRMYMPQKIEPGRYTLKLTIEDMKGHKFGQSSVDFQIVQ